MLNINILVTSVGGDIGGNIVKIIKEQHFFNYSLVGTDIKDYVFSKKKLDFFYNTSQINNERYIDEILNIIQRHNINLIIPSSEGDISFLNDNRDLFENLNIKLLINSDNIIRTFFDKYKTYKILKQIGVSVPETYILDDYNNELKFPIILKSLKSSFSKRVNLINNQNELEWFLRNIKDKKKYIIQSYIGDIENEYTTAVYKNNNNIQMISFKRLLDGSRTSYAEIYNSEKLTNCTKVIANKLLLNGSVNIQSRKVNNDFFIFEINPRISSTVYIRNYFNFQDLLWWICDLFNFNIGFRINNIKKEGVAVLGYNYNFYNKK